MVPPYPEVRAHEQPRKGTSVAVSSFADLPLADRDRAWDGSAAEKRVREWAGAEEPPWAR